MSDNDYDKEHNVEHLKSQIRNLTQEKESFEKLWYTAQLTIATLEQEVSHYHGQMSQPNSLVNLKQEYLKTLKEMQAKLIDVNRKLELKAREVEGRHRERLDAEVKVATMEAKVNGSLGEN